MTLLSYLLLLVVLTLLSAVLIGLRLPKTHSAASRIRLQAAPDEVWSLITDRAHHPQWRPGLKAVELTEVDGRPGWVEICHRNARVSFVEILAEPHQRLVTRLADAGTLLSGQWTYDIEEDPLGTVVTITENAQIYHPLIRFFSRFVISYHGTMDIFLIALAGRLGETVRPEHLSLERTPGNEAVTPT